MTTVAFIIFAWVVAMPATALKQSSLTAGTSVQRMCTLQLANITHILPKIHRKPRDSPVFEAVTDSSRLKNALIVIDLKSPDAKLSPLADGVYLYGIVSDGRLGMMNRLIEPVDRAKISKPERPGPIFGRSRSVSYNHQNKADIFGIQVSKQRTHIGQDLLMSGEDLVATHDGLLLALADGDLGRLSNNNAEELFFVTAGFIKVRNGRIPFLTNGSGTYSAGQQSLDVSRSAFRHLGLEMSGTKLVDYSTKRVPDLHGSVALQVQLDLRMQEDPRWQKIVERTRAVMHEIEKAQITPNDIRNALGIDSTSPAGSFYETWTVKAPEESDPLIIYRFFFHGKPHRESLTEWKHSMDFFSQLVKQKREAN